MSRYSHPIVPGGLPEGAPDRCELAQKKAVPRRIGRTKGGLNSKLHAVCDGEGRPLVMLLSEGQMSDYKGAALMLDALPTAGTLLVIAHGGGIGVGQASAKLPSMRSRMAAKAGWPLSRAVPVTERYPAWI